MIHVFKRMETDHEFKTRIRDKFYGKSKDIPLQFALADEKFDDWVWEAFKAQRRIVEGESNNNPTRDKMTSSDYSVNTVTITIG